MEVILAVMAAPWLTQTLIWMAALQEAVVAVAAAAAAQLAPLLPRPVSTVVVLEVVAEPEQMEAGPCRFWNRVRRE